MMKRYISKILLLLIFHLGIWFFVGTPATAQEDFVLVIDAGHGGKDPGATNGRYKEKTINLNVALLFGKMVEKNLKDVRVVYTRKSDKYLTLRERSNMANAVKGSLLVSIHVNAAPGSYSGQTRNNAHGIETFTFGFSNNKEILELEKRENKYSTDETAPDASIESRIYRQIVFEVFTEREICMAQYAQGELVRKTRKTNRGVHKANFHVLRESKMPGILVELGFISNKTEVKYLTEHEEVYAGCLYRAFSKYYNKYHILSPDANVTTHTVVPYDDREQQAKASTEPITFKVQILSSDKALKKNDPRFKGHNVQSYYEKGLYKYTANETSSYSEAARLRKKLSASFPQAFIVAFKGEQRIDVQKAREECEK